NYANSQVSGSDAGLKKYSEITIGGGLGIFSPFGSMKDDYKRQLTYGINGDYGINKNISAGIDFLYSTMIAADQGQPRHATDLFYINPNLKYKFMLKDDEAAFYLQAGPGFYGTQSLNHTENEFGYELRYYNINKIKPGFHAGAGIDLYLGKIVSLNLNSLIHNYYDTDNKNKPMQFVTVQLGLKFKIF
ncbi:MAG: porin family protein, partial [Bacteroidetes bacterium]|nr:porin family protein [Bacteroidota bacterium]